MYARLKLSIISVHFRNPGFRLVSKPQKPVFLFRTGPTTTVSKKKKKKKKKKSSINILASPYSLHTGSSHSALV